MNYSYVTYMSNDRDYKGALLLNYNLKQLNSAYPLACIVLENVSERIIKLLSHYGIHVLRFSLNYILTNFNYSENYKNYVINKHYYGKFIVFNLTQFDKIVYLDTDLLINSNIDHLFDMNCDDKIYMTYDVLMTSECNVRFVKDNFNSGVIVMEPNKDKYNACYNYLNQYENHLTNSDTDQTILNYLNKNHTICVEILPYTYNCVSMISKTLQDRNLLVNPIIVHFTLAPKPWDYIDFNSCVVGGHIFGDSNLYFQRWVKMYFDMVQSNMKNHISDTHFVKYNDVFISCRNGDCDNNDVILFE